MKKYIFPITLALIIGLFMANFFMKQYDITGKITIKRGDEKVYYIQHGVYSSKESMQTSMADFENYIYNIENEMYYAYVGITKSVENANKIKKYFNEKGYDAYIKTKKTNNDGFLIVLGQYDNILSETNNTDTIRVVCNQVLAKYEEIVNAEY